MSILKTCPVCKLAKPTNEFYKDKQTKSGLSCYCKECKRKTQRPVSRAWYWDKMGGERKKPNYNMENRAEYVRKISKERRQMYRAQDAVHKAVKRGNIPSPSSLSCSGCGKTAAHYHHYLGYAKEHWLDVEPLCYRCHGLTRRKLSE